LKPRFGKYRLLGKLAQGGMAQIYLARQEGVGGFSKKVVIKRMRASQTEDTGLIKMFLSEAMLAGQLNHPNVVNVFDFNEAEGEQFIVMEYVDGPSLKKLLKLAKEQGKLLPVPHCLKIASYVCEGLAYVQNLRDDRSAELLNLVHRDVTPDNILVARSGAVKIVDFGIAKASTVDLKTQPGVVKGKMSYIAPEQLFNETLDGRADTYALGVVLYEALTGISPFLRENDAAIIDALLHFTPAPVTSLRPDAPPALDAIIAKAMARKRDDRWASPLELQLALEQELVKLMPVFTAGRLRELVAALDPAPPQEPEETTTSDSYKLPDDDEPKTDVLAIPEKLRQNAHPTGEMKVDPPVATRLSQPKLEAVAASAPQPPPTVPIRETREREGLRVTRPPFPSPQPPLDPWPSRPPTSVQPAAVPVAPTRESQRALQPPGTSRSSQPVLPQVDHTVMQPAPVADHTVMQPAPVADHTVMQPAPTGPPAGANASDSADDMPASTALRPEIKDAAPRRTGLIGLAFAAIFGLSALATWGVMSMRAQQTAPVPAKAPVVVVAPAPKSEPKPVEPAPAPPPEKAEAPQPEPAAEPAAPEPEKPAEAAAVAPAAPDAVAAQGSTSAVSLTTTPPANVWIDGTKAGVTPLTLPLAFGPHKVRFESIEAGLNKIILLRVPNQPEFHREYSFEHATLKVEGPKGALLYLNKHKLAALPVEPLQLYEGTYTLRAVDAASGLDESRTVELKGGESTQRFGTAPTP
jgi:serine/threonine-protein kinase